MFNNSEEEYKFLVGDFIHECNVLEEIIVSNILGHYMDVDRLDLIGEFSEYFISPSNFTFQTSVTVFKKILNKTRCAFRRIFDKKMSVRVFSKRKSIENTFFY